MDIENISRWHGKLVEGKFHPNWKYGRSGCCRCWSATGVAQRCAWTGHVSPKYESLIQASVDYIRDNNLSGGGSYDFTA